MNAYTVVGPTNRQPRRLSSRASAPDSAVTDGTSAWPRSGPPAVGSKIQTKRASEPSAAAVAAFEQFGQGVRYPLATYTSLLAAPLIYATGQEVLPIGGFQGTNPSPTLSHLQRLIAQGQLHLILGPTDADPRMRWAAAHCRHVAPVAGLPVLYCGAPPGLG